MSILLDTGVIFAALNDRDARHEEAVSILRRVLAGEWGVPVVSGLVISELLTLVRVRGGTARDEGTAIAWLLGSEPAFGEIQRVALDWELLTMVAGDFKRYREHGLSFTDASHITLMRIHDIEHLATFDGKLVGLVPVVA